MTEMPAGTYTNQNENIPVLAQRYLVVALDSISEEAAYQITKAAVSNFKRLSTVYKGWSTCSVETVLQSMNIPLHPGAVRYYREINLPGLDDYIKTHPAK